MQVIRKPLPCGLKTSSKHNIFLKHWQCFMFSPIVLSSFRTRSLWFRAHLLSCGNKTKTRKTLFCCWWVSPIRFPFVHHRRQVNSPSMLHKRKTALRLQQQKRKNKNHNSHSPIVILLVTPSSWRGRGEAWGAVVGSVSTPPTCIAHSFPVWEL